ncbi:MAG: tRNA pseudouridine(55) synthase TruB [Candidatus Magnetoovum sp. WYHC-5]|nr:tRNA pseudouridine(55) synthase TruB [Candidatus Magnetoovum sp. WYHC-5]
MDVLVNLDKPEGMTSSDVVQEVKGLLNVKKAGHCGTLDPLATGVLLICTGHATVLADYFALMTKEYVVTLKLGVRTDSFDRCGKIIEERDSAFVTREMFALALENFTGEIVQKPPMYSAIKVSGVALYKMARKGMEVDRKDRVVRIYNNVVERFEYPWVTLRVSCSKGTYVRALVNDIGECLGTCATVWALRRTAVGSYRVDGAATFGSLSIDGVGGGHGIITMDDALTQMPVLVVDDESAWRLVNGQVVSLNGAAFEGSGDFRIKGPDGVLVGIGLYKEGGIKIQTLLINRDKYLKHLFKKNC